MTRYSVVATIETRPSAVTFPCPHCHVWQRIDYDEFIGKEDRLWNGELEVTCRNCGNTVRLSECEWDV